MWLTAFLALLFVYLLASYYLLRPSRLPPGPVGWPFIGNLLQIPAVRPHEQFKRWAVEYGPIYSVSLGSRKTIVLNSPLVVRDLLDKRGNLYSSRPSSYITGIANGDLNFTMMASIFRKEHLQPYNTTWKLCHRLFAASLSTQASRSYVPYQDLESQQMMFEMLDHAKMLSNPGAFRRNIQRYTYSVMTQVVLGFRTVDMGDPNLQALFDGFEQWSQLMGQASSILVDLFPILRYLPKAIVPATRKAEAIHKAQLNLFLSHWNRIKEEDQTGALQPCIAQQILRAQEKEGFSDALAAYTCGFLLIAGSETIATQLIIFIEAMILFPDVQKNAQDEIDRACGNRTPNVGDDLPYIRAVVKETCRWIPAAILGIPHAVTQDDEYAGYHIPKDAIIMLNVWAIHRDPKLYRNPEIFDPMRFYFDRKSARESASSGDAWLRDHFLFGAGRRLCAGMDIAENALFLGIARMLWAFDIGAGRDGEGKRVVPDPADIVVGLAASPREFPASITARSQGRSVAIKAEWERVRMQKLDGEEQWKQK